MTETLDDLWAEARAAFEPMPGIMYRLGFALAIHDHDGAVRSIDALRQRLQVVMSVAEEVRDNAHRHR